MTGIKGPTDSSRARQALREKLSTLAKTDRQDLMQRLRAATQELDAKNRELQMMIDQRDRFIGMAAHDLRNPLAVIQGYAEILVDDLREVVPPEEIALITSIANASRRMLGLVEGILDVTAVARGHVAINLEPVDIPNLIGELSKGYSLLAKDKQLGFILETEGGHIITDPLRLSQIVDNLVSNALKFSAPGGQVALRAVVMDRELCIEVEDHGPGIEDSQLALLFEYFRTGQAHSTGGEKRYGIGLAVVRALVDALGGRITVRSKTGEGSTFTVILPEGGLRSVESTGP